MFPEQLQICKHGWLQDHEEFLPHPFYHLIRCLECNRIIIDKSNPKEWYKKELELRGSASSVIKEADD